MSVRNGTATLTSGVLRGVCIGIASFAIDLSWWRSLIFIFAMAFATGLRGASE